ncbi:MAG: type II toxin-antitoxin system VapC family toxin [Bacteroidetes bacterium]|nr:type II toxin-antitoxin system VapC family toxin [Bacteroidota bacterium]MBI3481978.1 type II toxin-antitoxin system VapC family toxin [Bacteroidota bacterium]
MEETELVICDSNVIIELLDRANKKVENQLIELGRDRLAISSVTYSEIIFGSRNKAHQNTLIRGLEKFALIEIDAIVDSIHRELIKRYSLSHGLDIQDAIVAATALKDDLSLYTLNKRDFSFIQGIRLIK